MVAPVVLLVAPEALAALAAASGAAAYLTTPQGRKALANSIDSASDVIGKAFSPSSDGVKEFCPQAVLSQAQPQARSRSKEDTRQLERDCGRLLDAEKTAVRAKLDADRRLNEASEKWKKAAKWFAELAAGKAQFDVTTADTNQENEAKEEYEQALKEHKQRMGESQKAREAADACRKRSKANAQQREKDQAEQRRRQEQERFLQEAREANRREAQDRHRRANERAREYTEKMPLRRRDPATLEFTYPDPAGSGYVTFQELVRHFGKAP